MEKRDNLTHQKIFRQIDSFVTYLSIQTVTFTKLLQKCVRERSVKKEKSAVTEKKFSSNPLFSKNVTFTKLLPKMHERAQCEKKEKSTVTEKKFRQIIFLVKTLFSQRCVTLWRKFP